MIPTVCKMPDISDLDFPLKSRLMIHALVGNKELSHKECLYRTNFVRLVDKAIIGSIAVANTLLKKPRFYQL